MAIGYGALSVRAKDRREGCGEEESCRQGRFRVFTLNGNGGVYSQVYSDQAAYFQGRPREDSPSRQFRVTKGIFEEDVLIRHVGH